MLITRVIGLVAVFAGLKILTNVIGKAQYAEFNLAMTAVVLAYSVLLAPMERAYLRVFHSAEEKGAGRSATRTTLRWFLIVTIGMTAAAAALTLPASSWFGIAAGTTLAGGLIFFADRWRFLGIEVLNIRRDRRAFALHTIGFQVTQVTTVSVVVWLVSPTAVAGLFAYAGVAVIFAVLGVMPLLRQAREPGDAAHQPMRSMVATFGVPYGALLLFQWVQSFADRYILAWQLDLAAAGVYVAAYQVCGVPYVFLANILDALLRPIAYQRARDVSDPRQLWAADKALLLGVLLYVVVGGVMLFAYGLFGPRLIVLLTSGGFELPAATVLLLALGRYVQCVTFIIQMFFEVHQAMTSSLSFRLVGALMTVPVVWLAVHFYQSLLGAAVGVFVAVTIYVALLTLGPGGALWLVVRNYRRMQTDASGPGGLTS